MKKLFCIFIIFSTSAYSQIIEIVDSSAVYIDSFIGKVDTRDSFCFSEIDRAKKDFENGNITFYNYIDSRTSIRSLKIFESLIKKMNLKYEEILVGCEFITLHTKTFVPKSGCYKHCMNILVDKKYSNSFFEKLENKSDSLYVLNHINDVFSFEETDLHTIRYKKSKNKDYNDQFTDIDNELKKLIVYPKDFKYKNEESFSYSTCNFIINKDGSISNITLETSFQNHYNDKFKKYFEKIIKQFVINSKWLPATSHGIKIKSWWDVNLQYK